MAVGPESQPRLSRLSLNSDGERHPTENFLALFTLVIGIAAFAIGFFVRLHFPGLVLGIIGFVVGLYAQMVSNNRQQRIIIMTGIIGAFVGLGLSVAHGGFS
jgi:hypothetical protein